MALPQLPQLTRDQIAKIFKDPTLIRAYDALQRALQSTPGDVEALTETVDGLQALQYLLFALDPLAPNARRLVAGTGVTFTDGGEGGDLAINAAGLSPIVDKTIASNISGAPAVPIGNTLSALFDSILGNTQGQIITRNAGTWTVLGPGTAKQALQTGGAGANVAWADPALVTINTQTASYTVTAADCDPKTPTLVKMNVAGANTLTFPLNATIPIAIGSVVGWMQYGAGTITLTPGTGAVNLRSSGSLTSRAQYSSGTATKIATDEWLIEGDTP